MDTIEKTSIPVYRASIPVQKQMTAVRKAWNALLDASDQLSKIEAENPFGSNAGDGMPHGHNISDPTYQQASELMEMRSQYTKALAWYTTEEDALREMVGDEDFSILIRELTA